MSDFRKPPPKGFQGLRRDLPVCRYQRRLPHLRQDGATYLATFHLNDALPAQALRELAFQRAGSDCTAGSPCPDKLTIGHARQRAAAEERWLDAGHGTCLFRREKAREIMREAFHYFDFGTGSGNRSCRYQLGAWVIMPNHVHVLIRPLNPGRYPLEKILQGWKSGTSLKVNRMHGTRGAMWFEESYDRIVRDSEHLWRCVQYIGRNGARAGLPPQDYERWVCPEWMEQGWGFEDA
jgi:REP element-mobilizing transposase RayT